MLPTIHRQKSYRFYFNSNEETRMHVHIAQKNLLIAYENDFAKHAPGREIPKLGSIWDSIPAQLGRENKK